MYLKMQGNGEWMQGCVGSLPMPWQCLQNSRRCLRRTRQQETRMAILRDRPYSQFNFLVDLGTGVTDTPAAGFQEVSGIGMEVTVAEYRNGNSKENSVMK